MTSTVEVKAEKLMQEIERNIEKRTVWKEFAGRKVSRSRGMSQPLYICFLKLICTKTLSRDKALNEDLAFKINEGRKII